MPDTQRELAITRVAFLELKDEQQLVREGYQLLDEKRILLATHIQRHLAHLHKLQVDLQAVQRAARESVVGAVVCHGMDELEVYSPLPMNSDRLRIARTRLLGLELIDAHLETDAAQKAPAHTPVNPTPEARECALAHRKWLTVAVEVASCSVNLRRLVREYIRTERRARAIENIVLPEIDSALKIIDEQLESLDHEELARIRTAGSQHETGQIREIP